MPGKYELKVTPKGKFMFNLKAGNGEVILTSEKYESRAAAMNGIKSVQKNGAAKTAFDTRQAKDGQTYFVVIAKNKEIIGRSEMYPAPAAASRGIAAVMRNAGSAVVDLTKEAPKAKAPAAKAAPKKAAAKKAAPKKAAPKKAAAPQVAAAAAAGAEETPSA
jgi:hypothetical protein